MMQLMPYRSVFAVVLPCLSGALDCAVFAGGGLDSFKSSINRELLFKVRFLLLTSFFPFLRWLGYAGSADFIVLLHCFPAPPCQCVLIIRIKIFNIYIWMTVGEKITNNWLKINKPNRYTRQNFKIEIGHCHISSPKKLF